MIEVPEFHQIGMLEMCIGPATFATMDKKSRHRPCGKIYTVTFPDGSFIPFRVY